jgi:NADH-quinone oxidoreductase subunit M
MGVPGLNSFVGEFLILAGTIRTSPLVVVLSFVGIILPLIYMVRLLQELLFQKERQPLAVADLDLREMAILAALLLLNIWVGVHPAPLLDLIHLPVQLLTGGAP